jgi:hypothetical protein
VPGPGARTLSQGLPGTLIETYTDVNDGVFFANNTFEWESGPITIDEVEYAVDGTVRAFSGRINIIGKAPGTTNRVIMTGSFRYHPNVP